MDDAPDDGMGPYFHGTSLKRALTIRLRGATEHLGGAGARLIARRREDGTELAAYLSWDFQCAAGYGTDELLDDEDEHCVMTARLAPTDHRRQVGRSTSL